MGGDDGLVWVNVLSGRREELGRGPKEEAQGSEKHSG